jgi:NADH dehydrogenase
MSTEKVLIVGGGFGGLKAALELCKDDRFSVTLLTDHNDFRYYPTLYHTATGGKRASSTVPFENIFEGKGITIVIDKAVSLDRKAKTITTETGEAQSYDMLILGLGVVTNYFAIPGLADLSYGIKTDADAVKFRQHIHQQIVEERKPDANYLIVGAGPTGIELSGALPAYIKHLQKSHHLPIKKAKIHLIEAAPRLLPRLPKVTSLRVRIRLRRLGVRLHVGQVVQGQTADALTMNGRQIKSHTVVWTAGVTNNPFFSENHFVLMPRGKVATDVYLQAEDNIFIVGDNANTPFSGLAQTAVRDGAFVAKNIRRRKSGKSMKAYKPKIPISVIPVGRRWALVSWGKFEFHGYIGWLLRSAADFVAFKDLESWPKAAQQWLHDAGDEAPCPDCAQPISTH